jgi:hypothetical protein
LFYKKASEYPDGNMAFTIPRGAAPLFGIAIFGCHLLGRSIFSLPCAGLMVTAYEGEGASMRVWIQRRGATQLK